MPLIHVNTLVEVDNEPRLRDLDLAARLNFNRLADIRELIARNRDELATYGSFPCRAENPGKQGGRPGKAYWLNEGQALVICALSRTDKAAEVRKAIIDVFMAYRRGKLVDVAAHYRRPPAEKVAPASVTQFRLVQEYAGGPALIFVSVPLSHVAPIIQAYAQVRH